MSVYGKKGIMTTINWDQAAAIYIVANDIINGKRAAQEISMTIPCAGGTSLALERTHGQTGQMETFLSINKNNESITFKFNIIEVQVKENNQMVVKVIEAGLGAFAKILEGYLEGINANAHLDKFGDDLEEYQKSDQQEKEQQLFNYK